MSSEEKKTQTEINNFRDLRFAYLHSKFGTHNSLQVPNQKVILNEDFVEFHNVVRIPEQIKHLNIYWINKGIAGEICVPGQWNYAYVDGKFYHMVKMHSQGFIEGVEEEGHMYNLIYDDWQNDWMNNTFYLKGTIELTGDPELVRENIHQTSPILENVNGYRFLNGVRKNTENDYITRIIYPDTPLPSMQVIGMTTLDKVVINMELKKFAEKNTPKPVEEKLLIPFMYKIATPGNWKWVIINGLRNYLEKDLKVFDVSVNNAVEPGQVKSMRNILENMLGTTELYAVSSEDNRVYNFCTAVNPAKGVSEIDLSECTDIIVYDRLRLVPLYGVANPEPKFTIEGFVEGILRKHNGPSSYKDEMIESFENVVVPLLAHLITYDEPLDNKIFRNVTLEKIDRDIVHTGDPRGAVKNPEGKDGADTRLVLGKHHQNNMGDNTKGIITVCEGLKIEMTGDNVEEGDELDTNYMRMIEDGFTLFGESDNKINGANYHISPLNSLVYLPDEYKLVAEEGDNTELDFSKNLNEMYDWFALIPDYDRKTHTLAYKFRHKFEKYFQNDRLIYDPRNTAFGNRNIAGFTPGILPIIFDEILQEDETIIPLDGEKPSTELLKIYLNLGSDYSQPVPEETGKYFENRDRQSSFRVGGAKGLSKGYAFWMLSNVEPSEFAINGNNRTYYTTVHKNGKAACFGGYCRINEGNSGSVNSAYSSYKEYATLPECVYEDEKREWRRFHTEMTFPVKADTIDIISLLRYYDDIPDNFLRGEVINSKISKGKIKKTVRTIQKTGSGRLNASTLSTDEEKKVPKDTIVSIGLCNRPSGSPEGDRDFDKQAIDKYKQDHPDKNLQDRIFKLKEKLYEYFFKAKGEEGGEMGAIPCRMRNETTVNSRIYPKSGGQSQMSLSWAKPHKGGGYVAGTRFVPPKMDNAFRFTDSGYLDFDKQGTEDGITAIVPNIYAYSSDYKPKFTYREKSTSSLYRDIQLAFMTSNIVNNEIDELTDFDGNRYTSYGYNDKNPAYIFRWGNENKSIDGRPADYLHERFQKYFYNGNTLLLNDFFDNARSYKTLRLSNPIKTPARWKSSNTKSDTTAIAKPRSKRQMSVFSFPNTWVLFDKDKPKKPAPPPPPKPREHFFTPFNEEVPPFIIPYMSLDNPLCDLHHWERDDKIIQKDHRLALYREKILGMARSIVQMLENYNTFIKFEGTNGYASIKLNTKDKYPRGDYELFTNERSAFKSKDTEKWNFINHHEADIDVLINTRNELNIYGNKFPLKSRKITEEDELDIGLHVKAIDDIKQTPATAWYRVQMNLNEQDVIETFVETPKLQTKQSEFSPFEMERMVREIRLKGDQYLFNKQMIEYQKEENKFTNQYNQDYNNLQRKYGIARGVMKMIGGAADMAIGGIGSAVAYSAINGVNPMGDSGVLNRRPGGNYGFDYEMYEFSPQERFTHSFHRPSAEYINFYKGRGRPPNRRAQFIHTGTPGAIDNRRMAHYALSQGGNATHGLGGIIDGALSIGEAIEGHTIREEYRKQKFDLAEKKLSAQGDILNRNYEFDRKNFMDDIGAMSANVNYPQLNNHIIYKMYNKEIGIEDIHIIQYYPSGNLLKYIKNYYREFGYNILVRDFECTGIESIVNHLRYQYIKEINHPNISITEMIQARALAGIKVIPWTQ